MIVSIEFENYNKPASPQLQGNHNNNNNEWTRRETTTLTLHSTRKLLNDWL